MHIHTCTNIFTHKQILIHTHYTYIHARTNTNTYLHTYAHMHIDRNIHTHPDTHTTQHRAKDGLSEMKSMHLSGG